MRLSILRSLVLCALSITPSAFADRFNDVECDDGKFIIDRSAPTGGYVFTYRFSGHLLSHLEAHQILNEQTTSTQGNRVTRIQYKGTISASLEVGPTYRGETKLAAQISTRVDTHHLNASVLSFEKDQYSPGYFLYVLQNKNKVAEYYFHHCNFGQWFR